MRTAAAYAHHLRKLLLLLKLIPMTISNCFRGIKMDKTFNLQLFGKDGKLTGSAVSLSKGEQATYDAEFLFNLDLNNDGVQGRNTSRFDETKYHRDKKLTAFKQNNNTDLHLDLHSGELLTSEDGIQLSPKSILSNQDGSSFLAIRTNLLLQ